MSFLVLEDYMRENRQNSRSERGKEQQLGGSTKDFIYV